MSTKTRCDVCKNVMDAHVVVGPFSLTIGKKAGKRHKGPTRYHDDVVSIFLSVNSKHDVCRTCQRRIVGLEDDPGHRSRETVQDKEEAP